MQFSVVIFDITDIKKRKVIEKFEIIGDDKNDAIDKAHTYSFEQHPGVKICLELRTL